MACSVVAVRPACRANLVNKSLMRSRRLVCSALVQQAACRPCGSSMCVHHLPPGGSLAASLGRAQRRVAKSLAQTQKKTLVQQGGFPFAGQTVKPFAMVTFRLGRVVSRHVGICRKLSELFIFQENRKCGNCRVCVRGGALSNLYWNLV